jgi:hypothetical protein
MVQYMGRNGRRLLDRISRCTIERLLIYYRAVDLMERDLVMTTNSTELARIGGSYPAQVRKDLSYFGCFGCSLLPPHIRQGMKGIGSPEYLTIYDSRGCGIDDIRAKRLLTEVLCADVVTRA